MSRAGQRSAEMDRVLGRIRKLLALAENNPSVEEAALAAERVRELLDAHHLSMADVELGAGGGSDVVLERDYDLGLKPGIWVKVLATLVATHTGCRFFTVGHPRDLPGKVYGRPGDLEVFGYLFEYLRRALDGACEREYERYRREGGRDHARTWKTNFYEGAAMTIAQRLEAKRASSDHASPATGALIRRRDDAVDRYIAEHVPHIKAVRARTGKVSAAGRWAGRRAGEGIGLHEGIAGGTDPTVPGALSPSFAPARPPPGSDPPAGALAPGPEAHRAARRNRRRKPGRPIPLPRDQGAPSEARGPGVGRRWAGRRVPPILEAGEEALIDYPDDHGNPTLAYLAQLHSPASRAPTRTALERMAFRLVGREIVKHESIHKSDWIAHRVPWGDLRREHTEALWSWCRETYSPSTANRMLSALRRVLEVAWDRGYMSRENYERATNIKSLKVRRLPSGRMLTYGEIRALVEACKADPRPAAGLRDAALIAVLGYGGLRRAEAVGLDLADWNPAEPSLLVRRGKGDRDREVFLDAASAACITDWVEERGGRTGPLLCGLGPRGTPTGKRLVPNSVLMALRKRARDAEIAPFSPHDLRRTCASELTAVSDLEFARRQLGHSSTEMTARYDRRPAADLKRAVRKRHFPW